MRIRTYLFGNWKRKQRKKAMHENVREIGGRKRLTWRRKLIHGIGRPNQTSSFNEFGFLNEGVHVLTTLPQRDIRVVLHACPFLLWLRTHVAFISLAHFYHFRYFFTIHLGLLSTHWVVSCKHGFCKKTKNGTFVGIGQNMINDARKKIRVYVLTTMQFFLWRTNIDMCCLFLNKIWEQTIMFPLNDKTNSFTNHQAMQNDMHCTCCLFASLPPCSFVCPKILGSLALHFHPLYP